jgi:transcriptional regulator with PAS, ATPase and Fis domain
MVEIVRLAMRAANSNATVLITGESGSGKEVLARAVHEFSPRRARAFIDVNCAALPDHLVESELFGYEKGAFSGADSAKPGMFELANRGTLFLDEIGELDMVRQSKLLRVLDGWPHYRLGGTRKIETDVRIVAATNSDLDAAVRAGKFRADLYHRLNQVRIAVPALRERRADIAPLAALFLEKCDHRLVLSAQALAVLEEYSWPGNVRELRNAIAKASLVADGGEILAEHLPSEMLVRKHQPTAGSDRHSLERLEQEVIFSALADAAGRGARAAAMLGISRRTLARRLKDYSGRSAQPAIGAQVSCC